MSAHCLAINVLALMMMIYISSSNGIIESPQYKVVYSNVDIQVRLYTESFWVSAHVPTQPGNSFLTSTKQGFHRLYQYIHGANLNSSKLAITAPILTSIIQTLHGTEYLVKLYFPATTTNLLKRTPPPQPNPDLNLQVEKWGTYCVAIKKFSGFATDDTINNQVKALFIKSNELFNIKSDSTKDSYGSFMIAQYDAPFRASGRLNEVWRNISGGGAGSSLFIEGCSV